MCEESSCNPVLSFECVSMSSSLRRYPSHRATSLKAAGVRCLKNTWQEARHVHKGDEGNIEGVAEANEASGLHGGVDVQTT